MGVQCVSDTCEQPMQDDWDFCPACGVDNRQPSRRLRIKQHHHRFPFRWGYCIKCGEPVDEPYRFGYRWRFRFLVATFIGSMVALLGAATIQLGNFMPSTPLGKWVQAWYSQPVTHRGRRRSYTYTTELGLDWTVGLGVLGVLLLLLSIALLYKVPLSDSSDL